MNSCDFSLFRQCNVNIQAILELCPWFVAESPSLGLVWDMVDCHTSIFWYNHQFLQNTGFHLRIAPCSYRDYTLHKAGSAPLCWCNLCFEKQVLCYSTRSSGLLPSGSPGTLFCTMCQILEYVGGSGHPCIHLQLSKGILQSLSHGLFVQALSCWSFLLVLASQRTAGPVSWAPFLLLAVLQVVPWLTSSPGPCTYPDSGKKQKFMNAVLTLY